MMNLTCQVCSRPYVLDYKNKKGHTKTKCNSCLVNCRKYSIMKKCIEYKGGKCQLCGYNKCTRALHFHHRDPSQKSFIISGNFSRKWEVIQMELDKCDLICANCHSELHFEEDKFKYETWTKREPAKFYTKICVQCKEEFKTPRRTTVYCSPKCQDSARCKYNKPSKEELIKLLETMNYSQIAKKYEMSDCAVHKWATKLSSRRAPNCTGSGR
jgi:hypothetical protein